MIASECPHCGASLPVRMPGRVSCVCGGEYFTGNLGLAPRPREKPTRTVGSVLRELVGCGCNLPCRKWDRRGLDWCREHAEQIAQCLTAEPRPAIPIDRAREMVRLAIEVAERATVQ